jgi:hypothetical protein
MSDTPASPAPASALAGRERDARCGETAAVSGSPQGGELWCMLDRHHEGPHWDSLDDISWSDGRPGE